ncbi:hypothetical protein AAFF_G00029210 [Aldrovandia affinis]|uniref:Uncharacterized protein n=1 Tax=Aldrovandia affinis TaxID=143900 RepID=A0AAD7WH11_9TELE|nr:hypothetical protein AAFF_G00029210 [Aldrovandia affinis]
MLSKEKDALDTSELDFSNLITGESETQMAQEEDGSGAGGTAGMAWERRYEKIWVEIEKREVKSHFKSVTAELKERFGETLMEARDSAPDASGEEDEKEEENALVRTAEEESSEEEEEEIIRPAARAKSATLLPIPEQRESGLEDSVTEPAESPQSERKTGLHPGTSQDPCHAESSQQGKLDHTADCITDGQENKQQPAGSDLKDDNTDLDSDTGNCKEGNAEPNSDEGSAISEPDPVPIPSPSPSPEPNTSQETNLCTDTLRTCKETEAEMKIPAVMEEDPDPTSCPLLACQHLRSPALL